MTLRTGPGGIRPGPSANPSLEELCVSQISSFGDCDFSAVCTPDVRRAMCGAGDGVQKHPAGVRSTSGGAAESPSVCTGTGASGISEELNVTSRKIKLQ